MHQPTATPGLFPSAAKPAHHHRFATSHLKHLSKLQVDGEPAIRAKILLGNIASYLNDATRKRILINAFTVRALRDGFAPARLAGILALMATAEYHYATKTATRTLPHLVVLTVDSDGDVRAKAFQASEQFLQSVKEHSKLHNGDTTASAPSASSVSGSERGRGRAASMKLGASRIQRTSE